MGDAQGLGGQAIASPQRGIDPLGQEADLVSYLIGKRVAVVVAHQDDESLWFGGLLSRLPKWTVTDLISLTRPAPARPDTTTRLNAFRQVAMEIGAMPKCLYCQDMPAATEIVIPDDCWIFSVVSMAVEHAEPDVVISHGPAGEPCNVYPGGHSVHKMAAAAVRKVAHEMLIPYIYHDLTGAYTVTFDPAMKKRLLDFYAPQWAPDAYPWREPEMYDVVGVQSTPDTKGQS